MNGYALALLAVAMAAGFLVLRVLAMKRVNMGKRLPLLNALAAAGTIVGVAAFAFEPGIFGGFLDGLSVLVGAGFLALGIFLSALSRPTLAVTVGAPLLKPSGVRRLPIPTTILADSETMSVQMPPLWRHVTR